MSHTMSVQEKPQVVNVTQAVTYNRKGKVYQAHLNGAHLGEADTRAAAEVIVFEAANPTIARWIGNVKRDDPQLDGRVHRAGKLALGGHVKRNGRGWLVESQTTEGTEYRVTWDREWYCECEDFYNGWAGQDWGAPFRQGLGHVCKHILAVQLVDAYQTRKGAN